MGDDGSFFSEFVLFFSSGYFSVSCNASHCKRAHKITVRYLPDDVAFLSISIHVTLLNKSLLSCVQLWIRISVEAHLRSVDFIANIVENLSITIERLQQECINLLIDIKKTR